MHTVFRALAAAALLAPVAAQAASIAFDCDTPSDHASSVNFPVGAAVRASGTLSAVTFRQAKGAPLGGFMLNSADGLNTVGFQLLLPKPDATGLDLVLVAKNNGKAQRQVLRAVPFGTAVPFSLVLPATGQGRFTLGETTIDLKFAGLKSGTAMAFCSSGQFSFSNLDVGTP